MSIFPCYSLHSSHPLLSTVICPLLLCHSLRADLSTLYHSECLKILDKIQVGYVSVESNLFFFPFGFLQLNKCTRCRNSVVVQSLSGVQLCETPWTVAHQAPLSTEFSRQEHWSGLSFPTPGDLPVPGVEPASPALAGAFFTTELSGEPCRDSVAKRKYRAK